MQNLSPKAKKPVQQKLDKIAMAGYATLIVCRFYDKFKLYAVQFDDGDFNALPDNGSRCRQRENEQACVTWDFTCHAF